MHSLFGKYHELIPSMGQAWPEVPLPPESGHGGGQKKGAGRPSTTTLSPVLMGVEPADMGLKWC